MTTACLVFNPLKQASNPTPDVKRTLRIAIMESDDLVRELVETWLVDAGHKVETVKLPTKLNLCGS